MTHDLRTSITAAFRYLETLSVAIPPDVVMAARLKGIRATKAASDLASVNAAYHDAITQALTTYLEGGTVTAPRNQFKQATAIAFGDAMDLGTVGGGGELPFVDDALEWFNARVDQEFGNIESLFVQAKELRKDAEADFFVWVTNRADAYTRSVAGVYNAALLFAKNQQMLTWNLGNTEKHCDTCLKLDGNSHRASWYIKYDYIPRKPGAGMDCGGYHCDCSLKDKDGKEVTI